MLTILEIIQKTTDFFAGRGVESPRLDAELIVGHALGLKRMQLYLQFERPLKPADLDAIRPLVKRRAQREPLQHVLGDTEWAGLVLKTDRRALIPRPETEYLVSELLPARIGGMNTTGGAGPGAILDLGTGTGAIALALATRYPEARVVAVDASDEALALAAENRAALGLEARVEMVKSDWFSAVPGGSVFDVIVSNPPYLTDEETAAAEPEVREYEPVSALTAGDAGLADLRRIVAEARAFLAEGGLLALETGIAHHGALREWIAAQGYARSESARDLTERDRFVFAWR